MLIPNEKKRLFVWTGFCPDHTDGLAFAIARDEAEARQCVREAFHDGTGFRFEPEWGKLHVHELNETIAYCESGGG